MYTDSDVAHRHVARVRYRNRVVKYFTDSAEGRQRNMHVLHFSESAKSDSNAYNVMRSRRPKLPCNAFLCGKAQNHTSKR